MPVLAKLLLNALHGVAVAGPPAAGAVAQSAVEPPLRMLTQYSIERWTDADGLPYASLNAVAQTGDRFLWFAAEEGLIRFDGASFVVYSYASRPALGQSQLLALAAGADGGLWVGTAAAGLVRYRRGSFTVLRSADGLPSDRVQAVLVDDAGAVWAGTSRGLARVGRDGRVHRIEALQHDEVYALAPAPGGGVWVGTAAGVALVTSSGVRRFGAADGLPHADVRALAPGSQGVLWVGTTAGLAHFDGTRFTVPDARLSRIHVTAIAGDGGGGVWIGTSGAGLLRWRAGRLEALHGRNGGADMIRALLHDAEGSLWVATEGGGMLQLRASAIVPFGVTEGLSDDVALAVLQTRDGSRWVGTAGAGLNRIAPDGTVTRFDASSGLTARRVLSLAELPGGELLAGSSGGLLFRYRDGRFTEIGRALGLEGAILAILPDPRGGFWLGTTTGLVHAGGSGPPLRITAADGLADSFVMTLHRGRDGSLWVGTRKGASRLLDGRPVPLPARPAVAGVPVTAFFDPGDGAVWAATQGRGIVQLDAPAARQLDTAHGLCVDMVHAIVDDGAGSAWMSSNHGILRVPMAELAAFFAGRRDTVSCRLYGRAEGMRSRDANGGFMPAAVRLQDGRITFPTMQGIVTVDPRAVTDPPPPPPSLRLAVMDSDTAHLAALDAVRLTADLRDLEVQFTAPFYQGASRLRFRYMLEGFDATWRDGGNRRSAYYTNLPPGEYRFRVMAGNEAGQWHPQVAAVAVIVPHRFHETWWFRLLMLAALVTAALLLHRARTMAVSRRAERLQALVEERGRAEQRYRDLFENSSDMVFTTDRDGVITSWNRQAVAFTDWSAELATGRHIDEVIPQIGDIASTARREVSFHTRTGGSGIIEIATRPIEEQGVVTGYQVTGRDIRHWRQMQSRLQQAAKMEAVGQLAGGIAHDFNNLLTVITSSSALLESDLPEHAPLRADVQQIRAAADSAAALTRQLLLFSRRSVMQPRIVDVNLELARVIMMLRRTIGVDIQLEAELAPDVWPVCADGTQLEQVLMNLAVNARDAMPDGGVLRFTTANVQVTAADEDWLCIAAGAYVVLTVADTGTGMSEDVLPHIFEPFFTTKEPGRGTGLGLATVYGVVRQSGGHIFVDSTPGAGTRFRIFLPRAEREGAPAAVQQEPGIVQAVPADALILLAEDEPAVRALADRILTQHGFRVLAAGSGDEALAALDDAGRVDLLVTDMLMPGMNGRELAQRVHERDPSIRVLYISGYTEDDAIRGGALRRGERFLTKPFTPRELIEAVTAVLGGAALANE